LSVGQTRMPRFDPIALAWNGQGPFERLYEGLWMGAATVTLPEGKAFA
jgi:hypothetical protein